jgi:sulfur-carrier protein
MSRVVFTSNLQRYVPCPECDVAAGTVGGALEQVFRDNPPLRDYVLDEQGHLRRHVTVFIDGRRIVDRRRLSDPVKPQSEIYVLQALSGG